MTTTILLVEDDAAIRESLPLYFTTTEDLKVVATAPDGRAALQWLEDNKCDIVLSDIHMPDMDGIELLSRLNRLAQPPIFVAMTAFDTDETMLEVLTQGAAGYIIKGETPQGMIQAVYDALSGGTSLSPECVRRLIERSPWTMSRSGSVADQLTRTEESIIRKLAQGKTNKQIGEELFYSEAYIKKVISSLLQKFEVQSRIELVLKYAESAKR